MDSNLTPRMRQNSALMAHGILFLYVFSAWRYRSKTLARMLPKTMHTIWACQSSVIGATIPK